MSFTIKIIKGEKLSSREGLTITEAAVLDIKADSNAELLLMEILV